MNIKLSDYMQVNEAAKYLGVSKVTLREWTKRGKVKAIRHPVNNYRLYERKDLDEAVKGKEKEGE